jgi:hypothetical protein
VPCAVVQQVGESRLDRRLSKPPPADRTRSGRRAPARTHSLARLAGRRMSPWRVPLDGQEPSMQTVSAHATAVNALHFATFSNLPCPVLTMRFRLDKAEVAGSSPASPIRSLAGRSTISGGRCGAVRSTRAQRGLLTRAVRAATREHPRDGSRPASDGRPRPGAAIRRRGCGGPATRRA